MYADVSTPGVDVDGALATTDDADAAEVTNENYGALKVLCEDDRPRCLRRPRLHRAARV